MKNQHGGKKSKQNKNSIVVQKKELNFSVFGQSYARVTKKLGCKHVECECLVDNKLRKAKLGGGLRVKKIIIDVGNIILVTLRDYQDDYCDIVLKYDNEEVNNLITYGEIPTNFITSNNKTTIINGSNVLVDNDEIIFNYEDNDENT